MNAEQQQLQAIASIARRYLSNKQDIEDVCSIVWLECFEKGTQPTWLMIKHRCFDFRRSQVTREKYSTLYQQNSSGCSDERSTTTGLDLEIERLQSLIAIARFPMLQSSVLHKRFWQNLTIQEIASETGLSIPQVHQLLGDALNTLKMLALR